MRQFDQWIGGGHWSVVRENPRTWRAVAGRGPGSAGALAGMALAASRYSRHDASHVEPRGAQAKSVVNEYPCPDIWIGGGGEAYPD